MSQILPAIDLRGGRCVRLVQGDPEREAVYGDDPVAQARHWVAAGAERLHVVDLDGAFAGAPAQLPLVAEIVAAAGVPVQLGGGIRSAADARAALASGVDRVVVGTAAIEDPELLPALTAAHPAAVVLGVDTRGGQVATRGWAQTSELSGLALIERLAELPLAAIVYTDVARDGMLAGPNLEALAAVVAVAPWPVIASGGITTVADVRALRAMGVAGMIIGQALYTGALRLTDLLAG